MRTRIGLLGGVLVLLIGAGIAALAYQAGVTQGAASAASGAAPAVVYGPWFWGFGGFHLLGILFGLFILFIVARVVLGAIFWGGPGQWGRRGRGRWADGPGGRPDRDAFFAEMHRRFHEGEQASAGGAGAGVGGAASAGSAGGSGPWAGSTPHQDPGA